VKFISMEDTEVSVSEREISVGSLDGVEHETMRGAVHWLESMLFIVILQQEHVLFILVPMSRDTPELGIEEIRGDDL